LEAGRKHRALACGGTIFVSNESSADVVEEALNLGARRYVVKTRAGTDLLDAVEAVIAEKCFLAALGEFRHH